MEIMLKSLHVGLKIQIHPKTGQLNVQILNDDRGHVTYRILQKSGLVFQFQMFWDIPWLGPKSRQNVQYLIQYSNHGLNPQIFNNRTLFYHWNTGLDPYSDPHCMPEIFGFLFSIDVKKKAVNLIFYLPHGRFYSLSF